MKKSICVFLILLTGVFLTGCTSQSISEIKNDKYVGDLVVVSGTVKESMKVGDLSGFVIEGEDGNTIKVASDTLPAEGEDIVVKGTLIKDSIFGYYIERR